MVRALEGHSVSDTMSPTMVRAYADALAPVVRRSQSTIVLVHPPKAAGTAFTATARLAGWATPSLDGFRRASGYCTRCGRSCSRGKSWAEHIQPIERPGVIASVGHRSLGVAREVARRLSGASSSVQIMMPVRPAKPRLESAFRFIWGQAFRGGVETIVASSIHRWFGPALQHLPLTVAARLITRAPISPGHAERVHFETAIDAANYCVAGPDGLELDAARWLETFVRYGITPLSYWMGDICEYEDLRRSVEDGAVELVRNHEMDLACRRIFGQPALRKNVSIDAPRPEVARAIEEAGDLIAQLSQRDAAFEEIVA